MDGWSGQTGSRLRGAPDVTLVQWGQDACWQRGSSRLLPSQDAAAAIREACLRQAERRMRAMSVRLIRVGRVRALQAQSAVPVTETGRATPDSRARPTSASSSAEPAERALPAVAREAVPGATRLWTRPLHRREAPAAVLVATLAAGDTLAMGADIPARWMLDRIRPTAPLPMAHILLVGRQKQDATHRTQDRWVLSSPYERSSSCKIARRAR